MPNKAINELFTELLNNNIKWKLINQNTFNVNQSKMNGLFNTVVNQCNEQNEQFYKNKKRIDEYRKLLKNKNKILIKNKKLLESNNTKILSGNKSIQDEKEKNKRIKIYLIISYIVIILLIFFLIHTIKSFKNFF